MHDLPRRQIGAGLSLRCLLDIAGDVNADTFKMMNDSFQWNELIHTYHFRHDGFCDFLLEAMGKR